MLKGVLIGIVVPVLSSLIFKIVLSFFPRYYFFKVLDLEDIVKSGDLVSTFIQFGIIGNLVVFFYYMNKGNQPVQKGIVLPTLVFTLLAIYFKLF